MDIHAPHEPVHTWKDFAIHLAIVTIGLFIALMLEALVEHIHHRHIVREARENIRRELEANHDQIHEDLRYFQQNSDRIKTNVATLQIMLNDSLHGHYSISNHMDYSGMDTAAWHTARDTGALAFMPYDEVQRYSDIYDSSETINKRAEATAQIEFSALAPTMMGYDMRKLPHDEIINMLHGNAQTQMDLITEQQLLQQLDTAILEELKKK